VDIIAFSPVVEGGWDEVLLEVRNAKIPVILTDRAIKTADPSLYTSSIGSNFTTEGGSAAVWVKNEFRNAPGPVNIVELAGTPGSAPAVQRRAGFLEALRGNTKFKIVESRTANFSRAEGKAAMKKLLQSHDDIDVVFAQNDDMGLGAMAAIEDAGMQPGKDIKIVTVDAIRDGLVALSQRKINFVVECNPLIGPQLMALAQDIFLGIAVPPRVDTEEMVFFPENVKDYLNNREY
jgi:ABC-type sugar transport system substrate-binding protein